MPSSHGAAQSKGFPGCFNLKLWETLFPFCMHLKSMSQEVGAHVGNYFM